MTLDDAGHWETVFDDFFQVLKWILNQVSHMFESFLLMPALINPFFDCFALPHYQRKESIEEKNHIIFQRSNVEINRTRLLLIELVL